MAGVLSILEFFTGMIVLFWLGKMIGDALKLDKYLERTPVSRAQELK